MTRDTSEWEGGGAPFVTQLRRPDGVHDVVECVAWVQRRKQESPKDPVDRPAAAQGERALLLQWVDSADKVLQTVREDLRAAQQEVGQEKERAKRTEYECEIECERRIEQFMEAQAEGYELKVTACESALTAHFTEKSAAEQKRCEETVTDARQAVHEAVLRVSAEEGRAEAAFSEASRARVELAEATRQKAESDIEWRAILAEALADNEQAMDELCQARLQLSKSARLPAQEEESGAVTPRKVSAGGGHLQSPEEALKSACDTLSEECAQFEVAVGHHQELVARAKQEVQEEREQAQQQLSDADEVWHRRLASVQIAVTAKAREDNESAISSLQHAHAEAMARMEAMVERQQQDRYEEATAWQRKLAAVQEAEEAAAESTQRHIEDLAFARLKHEQALAKRDSELFEYVRERRRAEQKISELDAELANVTAELQNNVAAAQKEAKMQDEALQRFKQQEADGLEVAKEREACQNALMQADAELHDMRKELALERALLKEAHESREQAASELQQARAHAAALARESTEAHASREKVASELQQAQAQADALAKEVSKARSSANLEQYIQKLQHRDEEAALVRRDYEESLCRHTEAEQVLLRKLEAAESQAQGNQELAAEVLAGGQRALKELRQQSQDELARVVGEKVQQLVQQELEMKRMEGRLCDAERGRARADADLRVVRAKLQQERENTLVAKAAGESSLHRVLDGLAGAGVGIVPDRAASAGSPASPIVQLRCGTSVILDCPSSRDVSAPTSPFSTLKAGRRAAASADDAAESAGQANDVSLPSKVPAGQSPLTSAPLPCTTCA